MGTVSMTFFFLCTNILRFDQLNQLNPGTTELLAGIAVLYKCPGFLTGSGPGIQLSRLHLLELLRKRKDGCVVI